MYTVIYPERKKYIQYDDNQYMLYLNETEEEFVSDADPEDKRTALSGYAYTGDQPDGGTLIEAKEATYEAFVSGLIRMRYSQDAVEALQANRIAALTNPKQARAREFKAEWKEYQDYRKACKKQIQQFNLQNNG